MIITITGRIPSKKNSKRWIIRGNRKFLVPSKEHEIWHTDASFQLKIQKEAIPTYNIKMITLKYWMPDNRRCDLSNKTESVMDLLVDNGIIEDDCWQITGPVNMVPMGIDKKNPRVEIELSTD